MGEGPLPPWPADSFAAYLADAARNERVTSLNHAAVYDLSRDIHVLLERAEGALGHATAATILPRFMLIRTHAAYLAACRLAMSTQAAEAMCVVRVGLELAWYALHLARDPAPHQRLETWLRRNEGPDAAGRCRAEFTIARVRATHEGVDPETAASLRQLYDELIDYGAHPNQLGVLAAVRRQEEAGRVDYRVGILDPNPLTVMLALRQAAALGAGGLRVFTYVFPEEFWRANIPTSIDAVIDRLNTVFRRYGQRPE